jgi:hypothetical protein
MRRYALRDDQWDRIKDFLPGREGHVGGRYSLRHLLNRLINLRVSEAVREHGVHLAKGRPGARAERPLGRTAGTAPVPLII